MKYSENKMFADYEVLNGCPTKAVKLAIAAEYGITSCKAAEIQMAIIKALREIRREKTEFTPNDVKWFWRLNVPSIYKKAVEFYKLESLAFMKYLRDYWKTNQIDKKHYTWESSAYKSAVRTYEGFVQFINETDPEIIAKNAPEKELTDKIRERLLEDMKPFHDEYIARVERNATIYYTKLPEYIAYAENAAKKAKEKYYKADSECCDTWNAHTDEGMKKYKEMLPLVEKLRKMYDKALGNVRVLKATLKMFPTIEAYVAQRIKDAEKKYMYDVNAVADRVKERNFNVETLRVETVENDPKFFDMIITDGEKKMHARSIWAAEYSEKVTAHYRFIITNCK